MGEGTPSHVNIIYITYFGFDHIYCSLYIHTFDVSGHLQSFEIINYLQVIRDHKLSTQTETRVVSLGSLVVP